jgi:hypothetical protein
VSGTTRVVAGPQVRMYAADGELFAEDYALAHTLLSELGCDGRRLAPLRTPTTVAAPPEAPVLTRSPSPPR